MPEVAYSQLVPSVREVTVDELLDPLDLGARAGSERPYTVVNFVSSADGRATFHGRSGLLGDEGDRAMFHGLRERVDAVLAGTNTLRIERYGRVLGKPERRERRLARGESPEPLAVVISRSGDVPTSIPLFGEPEATVALFTTLEPPELAACAAQVSLHVLDVDELEPAGIMAILRREYGVRSLLCEGGPAIFGALLSSGLVDELFLTLAPSLVGGGEAPPLISGPEPVALSALEISWLLEREGSLYLRYRLGASGGATEPSSPV